MTEPRVVTFDHRGREYVELDLLLDPERAPLRRAKRMPKTGRIAPQREER